MTEQSRFSTDRSRRRRFSEVDYSFGEHYHFRSQVPFISFDGRLQRSRLLFANTGSLDPKDPVLDYVFRIIDSIGWSYTVMHVHPFCPSVVKEFISNKPFNNEGALIRGPSHTSLEANAPDGRDSISMLCSISSKIYTVFVS
ncbi:hypothetical protein DY000_02039399 [Brassica cretica]|uniref:Uncharacterized protein n=1 Tax=Brassica cretica TaxID=69181 RepID=A0ABQ7BAG3_BRACR|nr:hypothetical protein DY000_02039399 [Brassica cretica]